MNLVSFPNRSNRRHANTDLLQKAILSALGSGIDVTIITSRRLMLLEQLVTAGTITEFEIWKLRRRYSQLLTSRSDLEAGIQKPVSYRLSKPLSDLLTFSQGKLKIGYFQPKTGPREPVKSHLKLMIVDEEVTVLGSGNMDRASWFTSQELGVALLSKDVAANVAHCVHLGLENRVEWME